MTDKVLLPENYLRNKNNMIKSYLSANVREFLNVALYSELGQIQDMLMTDMENGFNDQPVPTPTKNDLDCIKGNLNEIKNYVILCPVDGTICLYLTNLLLMIKNWNDNVLKDNGLNNEVISISNLIELHLSFREILDINKILIQELRKIRHFQPIAYDTAKHFLESLDGAIEGDKIYNERDRKD